MDFKEALSVLDKTFVGNLEAKVLITKAVQKQIETKVTHEASLYRCCTCPSCKNVVDDFTDFNGKKIRVRNPFCKLCGQALGWGDK